MFDGAIAAADAGADQEACEPNTAVQVAANAFTYPATGYWTLLTGVANIVDSVNPTTVVDGLVVGYATLMWTIDNGPCGTTTDTVEVRLYDPQAPLADAGPNDSICTPTTISNLNAAVPAIPGHGIWTSLSGLGTIADTTAAVTTVTGLPVGVHQFVWFVYNGFCGFGTITSTDTVEVYVYDENSPAAAAGPDQEICSPTTTSVTMAGNSPIFPAFGTWTSPTGSGTIVNPNDPATDVTSLMIGVHQFVWTSFNGTCANSLTSDTVIIRVFDDNVPDPIAGPDQEICVPTQPNTVVMAADPASFPGNGFWTLISGSATIADTSSEVSQISDLVVGTHVFTWTISNGPCWLRSDTVEIRVYDAAQPNADAGADQVLCTPTTSTLLQGNSLISPAIGTWTILSGSGVIADVNDPLSDLTGLGIGTTVLVWEIYNGPCPSSPTTDTLVVEVFDSNSDPAMAGPDQDYCTPIFSTVTMFANSAILPAIGTWVLLSGSAVIADVNDPFTEITGLGLGENVFEWQIDNATCGTGQTADQISVFVYDDTEPAADAGPSVIYCQDISDHMFEASEPLTTGVGSWSLFSGTGTIVDPSNASSMVIDLPEGMHVFQWQIDNGTCGTTVDTMLIYIEDCLTLTIPDAFSPNGDGVNDTYVIDNLESYPLNSFKVFNRWGGKVLDRAPYANDWNGTSENSLNWGEELPESTYYYVLDLGDGSEAFTGFIYLKR